MGTARSTERTRQVRQYVSPRHLAALIVVASGALPDSDVAEGVKEAHDVIDETDPAVVNFLQAFSRLDEKAELAAKIKKAKASEPTSQPSVSAKVAAAGKELDRQYIHDIGGKAPPTVATRAVLAAWHTLLSWPSSLV